jgi:hypothetical protein
MCSVVHAISYELSTISYQLGAAALWWTQASPYPRTKDNASPLINKSCKRKSGRVRVT